MKTPQEEAEELVTTMTPTELRNVIAELIAVARAADRADHPRLFTMSEEPKSSQLESVVLCGCGCARPARFVVTAHEFHPGMAGGKGAKFTEACCASAKDYITESCHQLNLPDAVVTAIPTASPEQDPFQSAEYAKFVSSMVPHCHCRANNCPCDGVLAGGPCDMVQEEEPQERCDEDEDQP